MLAETSVVLQGAGIWSGIAGAGAAGVTSRKIPSDEFGKMIGWGTGQSAQAITQTRAVTQSLNPQLIREWIQQGLTREWVTKQLQFYQQALEMEKKRGSNVNLEPRLELMNRILELWPK